MSRATVASAVNGQGTVTVKGGDSAGSSGAPGDRETARAAVDGDAETRAIPPPSSRAEKLIDRLALEWERWCRAAPQQAARVRTGERVVREPDSSGVDPKLCPGFATGGHARPLCNALHQSRRGA